MPDKKKSHDKHVIRVDETPQNANWLRRPGGVLPPMPKPKPVQDEAHNGK